MKISNVLIALLFLSPSFAYSASPSAPRTLYIGTKGEDVRELQVFLNKETETLVANTGAGSKGNETDYFGTATKRALIKFQEKYRSEVLTPIGLVFGTGILGPKTREKINSLKIIRETASVIPQKESSKTTIEKGKVIVAFPSQYSGKPGTMISISGIGFTPTNNTIYFGNDHAVVSATSWNGQEITFKVPNISKGVYPIFVKNARGESNKDQFFVVTDGVTPEPKIESISPNIAVRGGTVTVKGSGFAATGNMVRSSVSIIENIDSADGASISFIIPVTLFKSTQSVSGSKFSMPVWVYVVNENGVSNEKKFILNL